jgi:hypothetical protein
MVGQGVVQSSSRCIVVEREVAIGDRKDVCDKNECQRSSKLNWAKVSRVPSRAQTGSSEGVI